MKAKVRVVKLHCMSNKRKYITRQSTHSTENGWIHSITNPKTQSVKGGIITNASTQRINEAKNESIHPFKNTKTPLLSDSKNANTHSITNVKPSVFKYSKCRTCRIPCSAEYFKKRDFEVKVVQINSAKCLKLNDSSISSLEEDRSKYGFAGKEFEKSEIGVNNKYNGYIQGKKLRTSARNADCHGENEIIKYAAEAPLKSKAHSLTDKLSLKNEDIYKGTIKKTDICKQLSCMSATSSQHTDHFSNCHTDVNIECEHELKYIAMEDNEYLPNNGVIDLNNVVVGLNNGVCRLKNRVCDLNKGRGLDNRVYDVNNDRKKSHDISTDREQIFSTEHSQKYIKSNKSRIYNDAKDLSGKKNIASKCIPETNTSKRDTCFDSKRNINSWNISSSSNADGSYKNLMDTVDNDITFYDETSCSDDTDSTPSENQINLVNGTNDILYNEKDKSKMLSTDENDNFMNSEYNKDQLCLQDVLSDEELLNTLNDVTHGHNNLRVHRSKHLNKTFEILKNIDTSLSDNTIENGIGIGNLVTNYQDEEHEYGTCKCDSVVSGHSKCISYLNRNNNSEHYHNLIHNRKHVRLKEKEEESLYSSTHDLLDKESLTYYLFESTKRLKFLHNHFYAPVVEPDEDILQSMLEDIELDIEIFDEDCYISNNEDGNVINRCEWNECNMQFNNSGHLLDHLKITHIEPLSDNSVFCCLWRKCKFSKQPSSYKWLSNHVLRHCSVRPFKCVILGCELSFATQNGLARHVPSHFNEGKVRRTCVLTGVGKSEEDGSRTKADIATNSMDNNEDNDEASEPIRKKTKYEKFVDRYKATGTINNSDENGINGIKYKLQISTCNSSMNCGYVGRYFRFNHKVIGKRTSKDGSTEMLLSPSSKKIFPYQSFWFDGNTLARQKSLFVDISVNNLSDDVKQHLYDNEQVSKLNSKGKRGM